MQTAQRRAQLPARALATRAGGSGLGSARARTQLALPLPQLEVRAGALRAMHPLYITSRRADMHHDGAQAATPTDPHFLASTRAWTLENWLDAHFELWGNFVSPLVQAFLRASFSSS
eukprot:CAMPEP_0172189292 /NCGR_PEP_ID=MMETSP1050-20130122/22436_1 /TAXON_ID=233186 /ORGANISM="Cryptomonas curvata, Strain CCAP979/52" /LENGTH=116 /DNA_ID=CAMNT_0012863957 /DNA_START=521 /DNA_END=868 /DNA_ORIENTATION=+